MMMKGFVINIIIDRYRLYESVGTWWCIDKRPSIDADMLSFAWRLSTTIDENCGFWVWPTLLMMHRGKRGNQQKPAIDNEEQQCHWANDDQSSPSTLIHSFVLCLHLSVHLNVRVPFTRELCTAFQSADRPIISGQQKQRLQPISPSFLLVNF